MARPAIQELETSYAQHSFVKPEEKRGDVVRLKSETGRVDLLRTRFRELRLSSFFQSEMPLDQGYSVDDVYGKWLPFNKQHAEVSQDGRMLDQFIAANVLGIFNPKRTEREMHHLHVAHHNGEEARVGTEGLKRSTAAGSEVNRLDGIRLWPNNIGPAGESRYKFFDTAVELWGVRASIFSDPELPANERDAKFEEARGKYEKLKESKLHDRRTGIWLQGLEVGTGGSGLKIPEEIDGPPPALIDVGVQLVANAAREVFDPVGAKKEFEEMVRRYYNPIEKVWPDTIKFQQRGKKGKKGDKPEETMWLYEDGKWVNLHGSGKITTWHLEGGGWVNQDGVRQGNVQDTLDEGRWSMIPQPVNYNLTDQMLGKVILPARYGRRREALVNYSLLENRFFENGKHRWVEPEDHGAITRDPVYKTGAQMLAIWAQHELGI